MMIRKLLEELINKLHEIEDVSDPLAPKGDGDAKGLEVVSVEPGEGSAAEEARDAKEGDSPSLPMMDPSDEKNGLDAIEHSHGDDEPCAKGCPVRDAIDTKLGRK